MKQIFVNVAAPFLSAKNALWSMLSEEGKISVKRSISTLFSVAIVYMVWYFLNKRVPIEDQPTFKHVIDMLCGMIVLLTGAATIKDIIALRTGKILPPDDADKPIEKVNAEPPAAN